MKWDYLRDGLEYANPGISWLGLSFWDWVKLSEFRFCANLRAKEGSFHECFDSSGSSPMMPLKFQYSFFGSSFRTWSSLSKCGQQSKICQSLPYTRQTYLSFPYARRMSSFKFSTCMLNLSQTNTSWEIKRQVQEGALNLQLNNAKIGRKGRINCSIHKIYEESHFWAWEISLEVLLTFNCEEGKTSLIFKPLSDRCVHIPAKTFRLRWRFENLDGGQGVPGQIKI